MYTSQSLNVAVKRLKYVQTFNLKSVTICRLMIDGDNNGGGGVGGSVGGGVGGGNDDDDEKIILGI